MASVIIGILLAVVFGAANAYLGLRVGMTVSASIPAAVISMVVMRVILRRNSLLESNMVQTIGSAGEALASGAIFTLPVFFLWEAEGMTDTPNLFTLSILAVCGGVIGVLLMIPLRRTLISKEHGILFCSGMVAGEGLAGILLAVLAVVGLSDKIDLSSVWSTDPIGGLILLLLLSASVFYMAKQKD